MNDMRGLTKEKLRSMIREEIEQMNEDPRGPDDFDFQSIEIGRSPGLHAKFWVPKEGEKLSSVAKVKIAPGGEPAFITAKDARRLAQKFRELANRK